MRRRLLIKWRWIRMPAPRLLTASVAVALVAGLTVAAVRVSSPASGAASHGDLRVTDDPAVPGAGVAPAAQAEPAKSTTVTLPTGDHVRVDPTPGGEQATLTSAGTAGGAATYVRFSSHGDQYVVPDQAVPFLHSALDPRLFDVSYLARERLGSTGGSDIPVDITYTSASQAPSVPGVHVSHRSGATANGSITTGQAARLGQLLTTRSRAERGTHAAGRLPGIRNISLARPAGASPLPPSPAQVQAPAAQGVPYYTLTLNFTDRSGNPGSFAGFTQNVGDVALGAPFTSGTGTESLSVPKGTYSLEFSVLTPSSSGTGFDTALVVKPQVKVNSDTTIAMDARTTVPYQATPDLSVNAARTDNLGIWRTSEVGGTCGGEGILAACGQYAGFLFIAAYSPNPAPDSLPNSLYATPTAAVSAGSFVFDANTELSDSVSGSTYVFDFPHEGSIPSSLTHSVHSKDLETVKTHIYQEPSSATAGCFADINTLTYLPLGDGEWTPAISFQATSVPGEHTDYWYSDNPGVGLWQNAFLGCHYTYGPLQAVHPGQQTSGVANKAPAVPQAAAPPYEFTGARGGVYTGDPRPTVCTACRQDNVGTVNILPFGDSDPSHYSRDPAFYGAGHLKFYRNGTLVQDSDEGTGGYANYPFGLELPLLPEAADYRLDLVQTAPETSSTIDTDWGFRSGPADPKASIPATEKCAPDATRSCSFLPLLFLRYDLPLSDTNQATAGTSEPIGFTVTGQQNAPAPTGLSATVSASFDGGQTWTTPQSATGHGAGRFSTTISQPPLASTNGFVALRVTAQDGSGDSITQTVLRAYGLTS